MSWTWRIALALAAGITVAISVRFSATANVIA
jgi:hypothetical protein